jgi:uncharacterized protein with HEPN domain
MSDEIKKYLFDIQVSIESIFDYLGERRDFFDYQNSKMLRRAVEREIEIIGEATSKILQLEPHIALGNARKIVDTRNWVIHGYDKVDDVIIWGIISNHLPLLLSEVKALLQATG